MKLMVRVLPGVELTCAIFSPSRALIKLDLPTLDRPRKATSGASGGGKCSGAAADFRKWVWSFMDVVVSAARRSLWKPYSIGRDAAPESLPAVAAVLVSN